MKRIPLEEAALHIENDHMRAALHNHFDRYGMRLFRELTKQTQGHVKLCECGACTTVREAGMLEYPAN